MEPLCLDSLWWFLFRVLSVTRALGNTTGGTVWMMFYGTSSSLHRGKAAHHNDGCNATLNPTDYWI